MERYRVMMDSDAVRIVTRGREERKSTKQCQINGQEQNARLDTRAVKGGSRHGPSLNRNSRVATGNDTETISFQAVSFLPSFLPSFPHVHSKLCFSKSVRRARRETRRHHQITRTHVLVARCRGKVELAWSY